jgi:uncharacterized protein
MVSARQIRELGARIAQDFSPQRIVLFGSYARGTPTKDSDVDLLVIMPCRGDPMDRAVEIRRSIDVPFALDVLVRTPESVRQRLAWNDFFLREVMEKGKVLYDAADRRMGRQGRGRLRQRAARAPGA